MRLIDADDVKYTRIRIFHGMNEDGTPCVGGWTAAILSCAIEDAPTVDAVPVVRCKDCMRRGTTDCPMLEAFNSYPFHEPEDDAFCSYGVACHTMKTVSQMMNEPKIKTHFARIVVCGTEQNPYYNILYYDPSDKEYHLGYGSYCISFVRQWLAEEFEITPGMNEPVVHGRWIKTVNGTRRNLNDGKFVRVYKYDCPVCGYHTGNQASNFNYCPNCGAKMDGGSEE